jgi:chorismate--pyruvate lyase
MRVCFPPGQTPLRFKLEAAQQGWLAHPSFLTRQYRAWLADQGSLTSRLKQRCRQFSVRPVRVGFTRPNRDERSLLQLRSGRLAYVREVVLNCDGRPVVFAHSVVADSSLRGAWAAITRLGSRPLGEALFSNPRVVRGSLQYRRVSTRHPLVRQAQQAGIIVTGKGLWARRSLFVLRGHPLLVTEVFLPAILSVECKQE